VDGEKVTLPGLQAMKRAGQKIVGVVAWDFQTARILDRAGVDIVSVGDSVGVNLWGREDESDVTLDELILVCAAVRRGAGRALVSCDLPRGQGVEAARRLVDEGGADVVKVEDDDGVPAYVHAGVPVFAQFSGGPAGGDGAVALAKRLEEAGASLLDFRHSGPVDGPKVVAAVSIPVIGGLGGGPWLDGRMRLIHRAIGGAAEALDEPPDSYANVAQVTLDAVAAYADDVRGGRHVRGG
jgi:3-methyl-2-oxobutanoate hydroxymethyltransferase